MVPKTAAHERMRPELLAFMFSLALALPSIGMFISGLMVGRLGLALCGLAVFLVILVLYFIGAELVFSNSEETSVPPKTALQ